MGEKNSINNRCRIAKHFRRNEIEVAPISSALLRIACLVILYETCRFRTKNLQPMGCRDRYVDSRSTIKQNENRLGGAVTGPWSYLVVRSRGSGRARSPHLCRAQCPEDAGWRQARCDRFRSYRVCGPQWCRDR